MDWEKALEIVFALMFFVVFAKILVLALEISRLNA